MEIKQSNILHDQSNQLFVLPIDDTQNAIIKYEIRDGVYYLVHSEVPYQLRGKGIGKLLVEKAFAYMDEHSIKAKSICSYIRIIAMRNPKWKHFL